MHSQHDQLRQQLSTLTLEQLHCLDGLIRRESRHDQPRPQLTAYVTIKDAAVNPTALKDRVAAQLPQYMIPTVLVELDEMPYLPNGKLDTKRLPTPLLLREQGAKVGADTESFNQFAQILAELLGMDIIHPDDNFFELGGDSITAIKLISRCREAGLNLSIKAVTSARTLAEIIAAGLEDKPKATKAQHKATGLCPLTPIQHWFFAQSHPAPQRWNLAGVVTLPDGLDPERLAQSIHTAVREHPVLGTAFRPSEYGWRALIPSTSPPELFSQHDSDDAEAVANTLQQAFELESGWLMRFALFADGKSLVWVAHHLIIDHLSIEPLISAIRRRYDDSDTASEQTSVSYREWSLRLEQLQKDRNGTPPDATASPDEPASTQQRPREADCDTAGVTLPVLSDDPSSAPEATLHDLLLLCLGNALRETLETDSLIIDIETHGRDQLGGDVDTAGSVGWFTSFHPQVFNPPPNATLTEQLRHMRDTTHAMHDAAQHYLLDRNGRRGDDTPAGQPSVLFNFTGARSDDAAAWTNRFEHWYCLRDPQNVRAHDLEF
ncbi:MAG: condensation domain-containing protein, partial [Pseudomonadota bacterium]